MCIQTARTLKAMPRQIWLHWLLWGATTERGLPAAGGASRLGTPRAGLKQNKTAHLEAFCTAGISSLPPLLTYELLSLHGHGHEPWVPSFISFCVWRREGEGCQGRRGQEETQVWDSRVEGRNDFHKSHPQGRAEGTGPAAMDIPHSMLSPRSSTSGSTRAPKQSLAWAGSAFFSFTSMLCEKNTACRPPTNTTPFPAPDHPCCCVRGDGGEEDEEERG